jgi:thiol-disulfide isomerase/thioredoxin
MAAATVGGCDDEPKRPAPSRKRSDSVVATGRPSATATTAATTTAKAAPKKRKAICVSVPEGLETPKGQLAAAAAAGASSGDLPNPIPFGAGKWIWVNLWAAWCKPCIAEMPRLRQFHQQLRKDGVLVDLAFVSLDDDGRQLQRFLDGEKQGGLRQSYWLKEDAREGWLAPFKVSADAELPVHLFVDPKGSVRCIINGAVEQDDFPKLSKMFQSGG